MADHKPFYIVRELGENEVKLPGMAELRNTEFLTVVKACKAILWPTPGFKERTFDSPGFSAEGTLMSVSAVPHWEEDLSERLLSLMVQNEDNAILLALSP